MSISSIDELLMGGNTSQQPMSPEEKMQQEPEAIEEMESDPYSEEPSIEPESEEYESDDDEPSEPQENKKKDADYDEYGNEQDAPRMYTESEHKELLNKAIRERFDRFNRNNPEVVPVVTQQQVQQQTNNFEYDPDSEHSLPQQLENFIEQTVSKMTNKREEQARAQKEQEIQAEFEEKLGHGMQKFSDFRDVVGNLPFQIDDPMILSTRAMENPAAFLYAAAKRHPQELERISKMRDSYAKMTEMGKLEERMRRNKPTTNAPRPLGRSQEDATTKAPVKQKDSSGDDLLAKADARRLSTVKTRLKGNR